MSKHIWRFGVLPFVVVAIVLLLSSCGLDGSRDASVSAGPSPSSTVASSVVSSTSSTVDPVRVDVFLGAWSDAENVAAFDVFQAEQARLDAEAAEAARQAQAEREAVAAQERVTQAATVPVQTTPAPAPASYGSGACGGDLPPCYVMMRESGGDPTAQNPSGDASGKWQFIDSTWAGYGGYAKARYAPESVQDEKARALWAGGAGCGHWSACG